MSKYTKFINTFKNEMDIEQLQESLMVHEVITRELELTDNEETDFKKDLKLLGFNFIDVGLEGTKKIMDYEYNHSYVHYGCKDTISGNKYCLDVYYYTRNKEYKNDLVVLMLRRKIGLLERIRTRNKNKYETILIDLYLKGNVEEYLNNIKQTIKDKTNKKELME